MRQRVRVHHAILHKDIWVKLRVILPSVKNVCWSHANLKEDVGRLQVFGAYLVLKVLALNLSTQHL